MSQFTVVLVWSRNLKHKNKYGYSQLQQYVQMAEKVTCLFFTLTIKKSQRCLFTHSLRRPIHVIQYHVHYFSYFCMCIVLLQIQVGATFCREEIPAFTGWSLAVACRLVVSKKRAT